MNKRLHWEDVINLAGTIYDKRIKWTPEDKLRIKELYKSGMSIHKIQEEIGCSRRTVQFVLFPERVKAMNAKRDWKRYSNREQLTKLVRELRQRKKLLFIEGKITF